MIKTIVIDSNLNSLNKTSSLILDIKDIDFAGGYSDFKKTESLDFENLELVIFDVENRNLKETIDYIEKIKNKNPKILFIATSKEINSQLVNNLKQNGIEEFILKPILQTVLEANIKKLIKQNPNDKRAKAITLFSLKSATGKTSTIINLAYDCAYLFNKKVCVLDLNINSSDIADYTGIKNKNDFEYITKNIENWDKNTLIDNLARYKDSSLYFLLAYDGINLNRNYSKDDIAKVISALKNVFDYVFIDIDTGIIERAVSIMRNIDMVIITGLFNLHQVNNIKQCYELFEKIGYNKHKLKLLINRVVQNSDDTMEKIETILNKKADFKIPNNYITLIDAISRTSFIEETNPQSNIAKTYKQIAQEITQMNFDEHCEKECLNDEIFDLANRMGE